MKRKKVGDSPEAVLKSMSPELMKIGDAIKGCQKRCSQGELKIAYKIGELVNKTIADPGHYGLHAIEELALYTSFPGGERSLDDRAQLANSYDWSYLEREVSMPMANGHFLSTYHFIYLARIAEDKRRANLLARVRRESLSVADLQDVISVAYQTRHNRAGGRKLKSPSSPEGGLARLAKNAQQFVKFEVVLNDAVFSKLEDASSRDLDDCMLDAIESAETATANAVKSMQHVLERLSAAKARVTQLLSEEENDDKVEDDEEDEDEEPQADEDEEIEDDVPAKRFLSRR